MRESSKRGPSDLGLPRRSKVVLGCVSADFCVVIVTQESVLTQPRTTLRRRGYILTPQNLSIPDGLKDWSEGTTFSNNSLCWFKVKVATAARNQQFPKHPWFTSNLVAPSTMNWGSDTNSEARFHVTHGILPFKDVEFGRNSGSSNNSPDCWHLLKNIKEHVNF